MDPLSALALNLYGDDIKEYIASHPDLAKRDRIWQDLIKEKFGLQVINATYQDYNALMSLNRDTFLDLCDIEEIAREIKEVILNGLQEIEDTSIANIRVWTPHPEMEWNESLRGVFTKAKTPSGALLNLLKYDAVKAEEVFTAYRNASQDIFTARCNWELQNILLGLMNRIKRGRYIHFPEAEEINYILEESREVGYIGSDEELVNDFTEFLDGGYEAQPYFESFPQLILI